MFFGIDLNQILTFPFKDAESRKYFLMGCVVALAGFIVPLLPYFVLYGYSVRIAKQVIYGETPRMIPWDDWEGMFKDGARMFGIRIIYSLPILIIVVPLFIAMIAMPFMTSTMNSSQLDAIFPIFMLIFFGAMFLIIPISLPLAVIIPTAEIYVVDKDDFAAGFHIREWGAILRANISGFIAAFAVYYLSSMVLGVAIQIIVATLIFACLLPFALPALIMYGLLIMYTATAQAYKIGKEKLAQSEIAGGIIS